MRKAQFVRTFWILEGVKKLEIRKMIYVINTEMLSLWLLCYAGSCGPPHQQLGRSINQSMVKTCWRRNMYEI